ncbi:MAG: hypothetical protein ACK4YK_16545 [Dolichospermum sp.]
MQKSVEVLLPVNVSLARHSRADIQLWVISKSIFSPPVQLP